MAELENLEQDSAGEQQDRVLSVGEALQAARLAKKLTQQDISNSLRYSIKQIDALEKNEFDLLPDAMIIRGLIRNYAKQLEIDAEPLLAIYRQSTASESNKVITVQSSMRPILLSKERQPWVKYILASIVVAVLLLAWLFYVDYMPESTGVTVKNAPKVIELAAPATVEPLPEIALPAAQRLAEENVAVLDLPAEPNAVLNQPAQAVAGIKPSEATAPEDIKSLSQPVVSMVNPGAADSTQVNPSDKALSMAFAGEAWVRVTDKAGTVIYENIFYDGNKKTIKVSPPLTVIVGNASATKLNFGGQDINLAAHTKNNVARITLE